jgi:hypothetical protein
VVDHFERASRPRPLIGVEGQKLRTRIVRDQDLELFAINERRWWSIKALLPQHGHRC